MQEDNQANEDSDNNQDSAVQSPPVATERAPRKSSFVGWLALLLVLGMAGAAAWLWPQLKALESDISQRLSALESGAGQEQADLDALGERFQGEMKNNLNQLQASIGSENTRLTESLQTLEEQLAQQRSELSRFSATDRDSWLIAEAEYLLRLANQRLLMAGDTESATALLSGADKVLRELDDVSLHKVRAAVASDLAAVRGVPKVDTEGIYLRLAALAEQASNLKIFQLPDAEAREVEEAADDLQAKLRNSFQSAREKLSDYLIVRRRDVPMQALMDPQWEGLVRQNLRMFLEQAQVALLAGNQTIFTESLQRSRHWVAQFFDSDEAAAKALDNEIEALSEAQIAVELPDISGSMQVLDAVVEKRLEQGGAE